MATGCCAAAHGDHVLLVVLAITIIVINNLSSPGWNY